MPYSVSWDVALAIFIYFLFAFLAILIPILLVIYILRRLFRHWVLTSPAGRIKEHREWEINRLREWIVVRREVVDRGWESIREVGEERPPGGEERERDARYAADERLKELEERLDALLTEREEELEVEEDERRRTEDGLGMRDEERGMLAGRAD